MSRITNSMLVTNYLSDMQTNLRTMSQSQSQMSSGQKIQRGSEDPAGATKIIKLNSELSANKQYKENISDVTNWLDTTDTALSEAGNVLSRIRTLVIKAGNGAYGDSDISTIKDEATSAIQQLGQELNTSFDGKYVFGGTKGNSKPVVVDSTGKISYADANGNATTDATVLKQIGSNLTVEISEGVKINYNQTASGLLSFTDSKLGNIDAPTVLSDIVTHLTAAANSEADPAGATAALASLNGDDLKKLDAVIGNFLQARSNVGTMQNRMESAGTNNDDQSYNMTSILSDTSDVDYTEASVMYSSAQTVYKAALQVSSKVIENTLLDYL